MVGLTRCDDLFKLFNLSLAAGEPESAPSLTRPRVVYRKLEDKVIPSVEPLHRPRFRRIEETPRAHFRDMECPRVLVKGFFVS